MTPTARSLAHLRELDWAAQVVEKWNPWSKRREDFFGIIDILAVDPDHGICGIQATSGTNHSARVAKARELLASDTDNGKRLRAFVKWHPLVVWSWAKRGGRGKRKTWTLRKERVQ